ncbi:MAG TPA: CotH kinase family protein [Polyangiaceae bacterium]|nr:CotH kinase family protein [Polyangiaceae bacterium]
MLVRILVPLWGLAACASEDLTRVFSGDGVSEGALPNLPAEESAIPEAAADPMGSGRASNAPAAGPGSALSAGPLGPPDSIYEREHRVEVQIEMDPRDFEALSFEGIGMGEILFPASGFREVPPYTHFAATVTVDGVTYENVDIRKKGYIGSLSVIRPSLKLDFERRLDRELVGGNRRMTLNNDLQDATHVKQCLSYDLFRQLGVPASRCNYAHVVVNGVDLGTYTHLEPVAKPLLRRYFDDVSGNLYEGQLSDFNVETEPYLELETNEEENDRSDVQAVIDALALPDDQVVAALSKLIDLDNFFDFWALETLLGHWDGYSDNSNNYFAYHDPTSGKFFFLPWGTDQTFVGDNPNTPVPYLISVYAEGTLSSRLYALPEQRERYRRRLAELNDTLWDVPTLLADMEALQRLVPEGARADATRLRSYIREHGEALRAALAQPAPEWVRVPPADPGDACQGSFGALSGSFTSEWGSISDTVDVALNGVPNSELSVVIDGAAVQGAFRSRAGEDGFRPGTANLRVAMPQPNNWYVVLDFSLPLELFETGYHPLHSFESFGQFSVFQPDFDAFITLGLIGDGGLELERASLQPGGSISGRFTGKVSYFACAGPLLSFVLPTPPPVPEAPPPVEEPPPAEPPAEEAAAEPAADAAALP